ncbi:YPDG domain-containing protein [Auritidibacter ignavus]|uniref:YPDG domain-containing protein n=1 Tax=Auritidibacter ignavus TaxID=678932 RepID=UPI00244ABC5D|nr:YPDG domain-containing protein [Auritidibacter ignavus]WGH80730.1 YPDG domain-containing protein [Auritidibacter ignavus]
MTEISKNSAGQWPAWRRGAMAAFTAFALVGGGVVCDVTQATVARADQADAPATDAPAAGEDATTPATGEDVSDAIVPKKVNPEGATNRYPRATNPQGTRPAPVASEVTGPVDADAIAAGRVRTYGQFADVTNRGSLGTFSGRLYYSNGVSFDSSNSGAEALNDVTLYLQWMDKDSPASPVFTAKTHKLAGTDGAFGFGDLNWVDENGTLHVYEPMSLINDVRIKVWVAPGQTGPGGGELKAIRQGPGMMNGFMNPGRDGHFGSFTTEQFSTQRGSVWVYEKPEGADPASYLTTPRDQWKIDNEGPVPTPSNTSGVGGNGPNMVSGRVWWESGEPDLFVPFPTRAGENPAPGTRVVMSVLTAEGRSAIRGLGNLPTGQRLQQQKALLEANPQYIKQTVVAPVGDNGRYTVRFDQPIPNADALYGFVINTDDEIVAGYTPWTVPAFGDPNDGTHTAAFWQPARGSLYNVYFALVPDPNRADISLDHDTGANTAGVGDVVTPSVNTVFYPGQNYAIRWVDENGNQVGNDCKITSAAEAANCTFTVPENAEPGTVYQARLIINGNIMDSAAFRVTEYAETLDPAYENASGAPGEQVTVPAPTYKNNQGQDVSAPAGTKYALRDDAPEGATIDENTGEITYTIAEDARNGSSIDIPVVVTYADESVDHVTATVNVVEPGVVSYPDVTVGDDGDRQVSVDPVITDAEGNPAEKGEGDRFEFGELPDGFVKDPSDESGNTIIWNGGTEDPADDITVVIDPETGQITVDAGEDADTQGPVQVPVRVVDQDGKPTYEGSVTIDVDPKAPAQAETFEPAYENASGAPGEQVTVPAPSFTDAEGKEAEAPEGTSFQAGENAPEGVTIDENTGEITFTVPEGATPGETIEIPVVVTYPDGSTDEVTVTVTVDEPEVVEPGVVSYPDVTVGDDGDRQVSVDPVITGAEGNPAEKGEGDRFEFGELPDGFVKDPSDESGNTIIWNGGTEDPADDITVVIDPETGQITVDAGEDADTDGPVQVPVRVVDQDGKPTYEGSVTIDVDPKAPAQAETFEPAYENASGAPGEQVTVPAPSFTDAEGKEAEAPEGTSFQAGENAPEGVSVDENTGEITFTVPEGATPGETIEIPVVVTYPDGSTDEVTVTVTVDEPDNGGGQEDTLADITTPTWENGTVEPGGSVDIPNSGDQLPEGSKVEATADAEGWKVSATDDGTLTVTAPEGAADGDKTTIEVTATYPDGSQDVEKVTVTVNDPNGGGDDEEDGTQADDITPSWVNSQVAPGESVEVPNTGEEIPEGSTVEASTDAEGWQVSATNDGTLTVTAPEGASHGDKAVVTVQVTYPDGSVDTEQVSVTVVDPAVGDDDDNNNQAAEVQPNWDNQEVAPGESVTAPNNGDALPEGSEVEATSSQDGWNVTVGDDHGITVTAPENASTGDKTTITVTVTYPDGSTDTETFTVTVNDPSGDNGGEEPGSDQASEVTPNWDNTTAQPGQTVEVPNNGDELPEGSQVEVASDQDGWTVEVGEDGSTIKVTAPEGATSGDKTEITVTVTYPDGSTDTETFTVTVTEPSDGGEGPGEQEKPNWGDAEGEPGERIVIPNEGGEVPEDTTVEVEGPGRASIDEDGNLVVEIDKDAKPRDTIVVVVKDKDGNVIDEITVTVTEPSDGGEGPGEQEKPNWGDAEGEPGERIVIPNEGGEVPEDTTVEVEGPGRASIDEDGNLVVEIDKDAKPGDTIVVVVKDKDGNVIDEITVTVTEPSDDGGAGDGGDKPGDGGDKPGDGSGKPGDGGAGDGSGKPGDGGAGDGAGDGSGKPGDGGSGDGAGDGAGYASDASSDHSDKLASTGAGVLGALGLVGGLLAAAGGLLARRRKSED